MSDDIKVTDGTILEALNGKVDLDGGNYAGSGLEAIVKKNGGGGGLEIGDIGIAPLGIDETKGKRRYLNGQLIIQDQYVQFTNKVKSAVALYPSLACTESEWQTTATMTVGGQVGKFVVDNDAGTIRLPKIIMPIQGLTDLSKLGEIVEAGLPNVEGVLGVQMRSGAQNTINSGALYFTEHNKYSYSNYGSGGSLEGTITFDASRSNPIYGKSNTVQQEQIQYPYFIQVATGAETKDEITNEHELVNPYVLLEPKFFETPVYNLSWLISNGSFTGSNAVHPHAYDALLIELNVDIAVGTTQNNYTKRGLPVKLATDSYTDYDFVVNPADETFRLPIKVKLASGKAVVGNGMAVGLTNGTTNYGLIGYSGGAYGITSQYGQPVKTGTTTGSNMAGTIGVTTDPTKSGIETSDSGLYLYFYVGETVQNANLINAGRIEEKLANYTTQGMVDGQWQKTSSTSATQLLSTTKVGAYEIDLSAYIPNDGYSYELIVTHRTVTSATNSDVYVTFKSSLTNNIPVGYLAGAKQASNATLLPISTDRKITFTLSSGVGTTSVQYCSVWLSAYRRLGTNQ